MRNDNMLRPRYSRCGINIRKETEKKGEQEVALLIYYMCLTVPNCILFLTNQFNKNTATVEHTKFKLDSARNNYSVDVDDDGAI